MIPSSKAPIKKEVAADKKSAENARRSRRRAFRAGKFPEDLITPEMIKTFHFNIECAPHSPVYSDFKVTEGMMLTQVPSFMAPPIEYCDHLQKINDVPINNKGDLFEALKQASLKKEPHYMTFQVRRIMSMEKIDARDYNKLPKNASIFIPDPPPADKDSTKESKVLKPNKEYSYFRVRLIYFPKSKLGISVKSFDNVVYVESTDNSWGSTSRRFMYVGDAILKIDDTELSDVGSTINAVQTGLSNNGIITLILERSTSREAADYVKCIIMHNKRPDCTYPVDAINACRARLKYHQKNGFGPEPKSIFKGPPPKGKSKETVKSKVNFMEDANKRREEENRRKTSAESGAKEDPIFCPKVVTSTIVSDMHNPHVLMKVPNFMDAAEVAKSVQKSE